MEHRETVNTAVPAMELSEIFRDFERYVRRLQENICNRLSECVGDEFSCEPWQRVGGGGGLTRIVSDGNVFEKAGINTAFVHGRVTPEIAGLINAEAELFAACGLSLVIHPRSPQIPSIHMNARCFEHSNGTVWFGGGIDLTPYFPHEKDITEFHQTIRDACDRAFPGAYARFKPACDEYFFLPHRGEMRGAGGVFFDNLGGHEEKHRRLVRELGNGFLPSFEPILQRRKNESYDGETREFQLYRRGRYVEFNLMLDRGTIFGLKSGGRVDSILMSLPPIVRFPYNWMPRPDSPLIAMSSYYQPREWLNMNGRRAGN